MLIFRGVFVVVAVLYPSKKIMERPIRFQLFVPLQRPLRFQRDWATRRSPAEKTHQNIGQKPCSNWAMLAYFWRKYQKKNHVDICKKCSKHSHFFAYIEESMGGDIIIHHQHHHHHHHHRHHHHHHHHHTPAWKLANTKWVCGNGCNWKATSVNGAVAKAWPHPPQHRNLTKFKSC